MKTLHAIAACLMLVFSSFAYSNEWANKIENHFNLEVDERGEGVTKYKSCWQDKVMCGLVFRDLHSLAWNFTEFGYDIDVRGFRDDSFIRASVAVIDCKNVALFLGPVSRGKKIDLEEFSFVSGGELSIKFKVNPLDVSVKNINRRGKSFIEERGNVFLNDDDIDFLLKLVNSGNLSVRISGDLGYSSLSKTGLKSFSSDYVRTVATYKKLRGLLDGVACRK